MAASQPTLIISGTSVTYWQFQTDSNGAFPVSNGEAVTTLHHVSKSACNIKLIGYDPAQTSKGRLVIEHPRFQIDVPVTYFGQGIHVNVTTPAGNIYVTDAQNLYDAITQL
jgi:hypothetical protein